MGHEMLHGTTWWKGTARICIVNAFHEDILRQQDWPVNANGVKENPNGPHKSVKEQLFLKEQASEPEQSDDNSSEDPDPEDGDGSDAIDPKDTSEPGNDPTAQARQPKRPLADSGDYTDSVDGRPNKRVRRGGAE